MIRVTCDNCDAPIDRDEGRWYGLDVTEPITQHPDPVQAMNDAEDEMLSVVTSTLQIGGGDHEFHLCGERCLVAWAMLRELNRED